jgi:hypothetical protein
VLGDVLRYTLTPVLGLIMLPLTLRALFGPCDVPERFKRGFPRLMMLRPWQLRASLGDGAVMDLHQHNNQDRRKNGSHGESSCLTKRLSPWGNPYDLEMI